MKNRYVLLSVFTILLIAGMLLIRPIIQISSTEVSLYTVKQEIIEETVTCTGRVESADSQEVYVEIPCVAANVEVAAGDEVKEGDVLFTIDIQATREALASLDSTASSLIMSQQINKTIKAPSSGIVRQLNVATGEAVNSDTPCAVISSSEVLQVKITIQEENIKKVKIGQSVSISGSAFTQDKYSGEVTSISPSARQQYTGPISETVIDALITLSQTDPSLKPGLSAKTNILIGETPECIVIPYEYVQQDEDNKEYVYLYEDGCAIKRVVETGREFSQGVEILSGLNAGENVISNPTDIRHNGETVAVCKEGVL